MCVQAGDCPAEKGHKGGLGSPQAPRWETCIFLQASGLQAGVCVSQSQSPSEGHKGSDNFKGISS